MNLLTRSSVVFSLAIVLIGSSYAEVSLWAGSMTIDITPSIGSEMPGSFTKKISTVIHDPLELNVLLLKTSETTVALISIDALAIPYDILRQARQKLSNISEFNPQNMMVSASHTHHGGPTVDVFLSESNPEYNSYLADKIAESVKITLSQLKPSKLTVHSSELHGIAFNRRFYMRDGTVVTHPGRKNPNIIAPAGPVDPQLIALYVYDENNEILAVVVNYTLHATVMGGLQFSADYIHYLREFLRKQWNKAVPIIFINGACGDVTQVDNLREDEQVETGEFWAKRIGESIGCETYKMSLWAKPMGDYTLTVAQQTLQIPIRDLSQTYRPTQGLGSEQQEIYDREIQLLQKMKEKSPYLPVEITAVRIGELAIVTNPTEMFCQIGLNIKASSPAKYTIVAELTNGYTGYCPTAEAFYEGGYEIVTARSSCMDPSASLIITQTSRQLLARLFN